MTSSSTSVAAKDQQPSPGTWPTIAPYVVPPIAAFTAIIPAFRDMVVKSAQQIGQPIPSMTLINGLKEGVKAAPTVGVIVGTQMVLQSLVEKSLSKDGDKDSLMSMLSSSAIVGTASAPVLAVFNGQTMGWSVRESLRKFSVKQGVAIAVQETAFVGGS